MLPEHILSEVERCCAIRLVQVADGFGHGLGCSERLLADLPKLEAFDDIEYWLSLPNGRYYFTATLGVSTAPDGIPLPAGDFDVTRARPPLPESVTHDPLIPYQATSVVAGGADYTASAREILRSSLPEGTYQFALIVHTRTRHVWLAAGSGIATLGLAWGHPSAPIREGAVQKSLELETPLASSSGLNSHRGGRASHSGDMSRLDGVSRFL